MAVPQFSKQQDRVGLGDVPMRMASAYAQRVSARGAARILLADDPMAGACVRRVNVGGGADLWGTVLGDGPLRMACARVRVQKL